MKIEQKTLQDLIKGNKKFKNVKFKEFKKEYDSLSKHGQNPEILFIGCCDSRVVPDLIVDSKPGDMFILRNIGNFVPPYVKDTAFHGNSSAIEYAVNILNVKDIIVCGHSNCGAISSLYNNLNNNPNLAHINKWLSLGMEAKNYVLNNNHPNSSKEDLIKQTEKISIKYQLNNLLTYPYIANKIKNKSLEIHGWYYKIEDGSIEVYDSKSLEFKNLN